MPLISKERGLLRNRVPRDIRCRRFVLEVEVRHAGAENTCVGKEDIVKPSGIRDNYGLRGRVRVLGALAPHIE